MNDKPLNPWKHEPDPRIIAVLGKMTEECGELTQIASRCIIQGIAEKQPVTGKHNEEALFEEMADVEALINIMKQTYPFDYTSYKNRVTCKEEHIREWLRMI